MPRGRKPKPVEDKRRRGNPGKRRLPTPLELDPTAPVPPADLPERARELWDELLSALGEASLVQRPDKAALTALCVQWARAEEARETLARDGLFTYGSMGQLVEHPAVKIERAAHQLLLRFCEHYGLTPVARSRLSASPGAGKPPREQGVIDASPELRLVGE